MPPGITKTVLQVFGMPDNLSREHVIDVLRSVRGVKDVAVSLHRGRATIVHGPGCSQKDLVGAVVRAGFGVMLNDTGAPGAPEKRRSGR